MFLATAARTVLQAEPAPPEPRPGAPLRLIGRDRKKHRLRIMEKEQIMIDSPDGYGIVSRFFHWLMTLLIGWQLLKFGDRIAEGEHWVGQTLVPFHVSIGVLLLVLAIARLGWAFSQSHQRPVHDPATAFFVRAGHGLLYAGMILMPLTGIMVMLGGGYGVTAFGVELIPEAEEVAWAEALGGLHSPLAWLFAALILGHVFMALFHHFIRRDDTLVRMA